MRHEITDENEDEFIKKLRKLYELKLFLSAHTISGWFGTFERIKRFYKEYIEETDADKKYEELPEIVF